MTQEEQMNITITGKHLDVGSSFQSYIKENLTKTIEKYFSSPIDAHVVIGYETDTFVRTDISVHPGRGISIRIHGIADKPYPSFDQALEKLGKKFKKYRHRLKAHHHQAGDSSYLAQQYVVEDHSDEESQGENVKPVTIAEMTTPLHHLTVSEAIMHLDLSEAPVIVFYNKSNSMINVVYKRKDGNIGWIDPQTSLATSK